MTDRHDELMAGLPRAFDAQGSSFFEVLRRQAPDAVPELLRSGELPRRLRDQLVEGTTVLAIAARDGVVVAGDRRATAGHQISRGDIRKVFPADDWSAIAISGAAGPAMELARVFATELEHYEKVEGEPLSLEGKSNKLGHMVRANLGLAMQGLVVVPLFAGIDPHDLTGRIYEYDPVGGRYRATEHAASGSGSLSARTTLKHLYDPQASVEQAARSALEALFDAAEEDAATGGPDLIRRIYPIVAMMDADGYRELDDETVAGILDEIIDPRRR